jgi:transposase
MHEAHVLRRQGKKITELVQEIGKSERTVYYYLRRTFEWSYFPRKSSLLLGMTAA